MSLFLRALRRRSYLFPIILICMVYSARVFDPMYLIVPVSKVGFIDVSEIIVPLVLFVHMTFLLSNNYEIELAMTCGVSAARLTFTNHLANLLYTLIPCYIIVALYQYKEFFPAPDDRIVIPIVIPENYKVYMLISVTVTVLFFSSVALLLRVLMRNMFTPILMSICIYMGLGGNNANIHSGRQDIRAAIVDPFISNYILGDTVPNTYEMGFHNMWTYNRLLFTGISVILLIITYLLLRREKLHESFGV